MNPNIRNRSEKFSARVCVVIIAALAALAWFGAYELGALIWGAL